MDSGILKRNLPSENLGGIAFLEILEGITNVGRKNDAPYLKVFINRPSIRGISHGFAILAPL